MNDFSLISIGHIIAFLLTLVMYGQTSSKILLRLFQVQVVVLVLTTAWAASEFHVDITLLIILLINLGIALNLKWLLSQPDTTSQGKLWDIPISHTISVAYSLLFVLVIAGGSFAAVLALAGTDYAKLAMAIAYVASGIIFILTRRGLVALTVGWLMVEHSVVIGAEMLNPVLSTTTVVALVTHFSLTLFVILTFAQVPSPVPEPVTGEDVKDHTHDKGEKQYVLDSNS